MRTLMTINDARAAARSRLSDLTAEGEGIGGRAGGRELTDGEQERLGRLAVAIDRERAALDALDAEAADVVRATVTAGDAEGPYQPHEPVAGPRPWPRLLERPAAWEAAARISALRALDGHRSVLSAPAADRLEAVLRRPDAVREAAYIAAVADPEYLGAFVKLLQHGELAKMRMTAREEQALDAVNTAMDLLAAAPMTSYTGATGGYAVPFDLDPSLINTSSGANCPLRSLARTQVLTSNIKHFVNQAGVVAAYGAEGSAMVEAGPAISQPTLTPARGSAFITTSFEFWQDASGAIGELAQAIADGRDTLDATKFLSGSGTNEPLGIATVGTAGALTNTQRVQSVGADAVVAADVYATWNAIPPRSQAATAWVGSAGTYSFLYRLTPSGSTTEPRLIDTFGGPLLGKPFYPWSTMFTAAASGEQTGHKVLIGGDWANAVTIGDRLGMTVEVVPVMLDPTTGYPTGQRGLLGWWRTGVVVHNVNALRFLEVA